MIPSFLEMALLSARRFGVTKRPLMLTFQPISVGAIRTAEGRAVLEGLEIEVYFRFEMH